jgi:hypothetical protein
MSFINWNTTSLCELPNITRSPSNLCFFRSVANFGYVTNLKIWKISNSEMSTRFERKTGNCLRVSCWVDTATLPEGDTLDDLCRHGFRFHSIPGYYFRTGGLVDPPEHTSNNTHQFVYCEVAIGRSRVNDSIHPTTRIPAGFDSFYVPTEKLDRNEDGEFSISEYQAAANFNFRDARSPLSSFSFLTASCRFYSHQYYVRDPLLVLPKYIVEYTLQPNPPISLPPSTDDSAVDDIAGSSQFEYFDPVQYRPVTLQEKLTNSKIARRLMTIPQAYQFAYEEAKKATSELSPSDAAAPTALPNQKQQWIHEQLESVDEIFRQITLNYAENCEKITTCCENALMKLQGLTREKLELLLSIETELRRETEEINWVEHHLKQQVKLTEQLQQQNQKRWGTGAGGVAGGAQGLAAQLQFLKYWKNSIVIMNSLNRSHATETDMLNEIVPDMRVDCDIQVYLQQQRQEQQQAPLGSPSRSPAHATSGDRKMDPKGNRPSMLPNPLPLNKNISNLTVGDDDPTDQSPRPASPSHPLGSGSISQHVSAYDLQHFLGTLQRIDYYAPPTGNQEGGGGSGPRPSEPLISPSTQALVNVNLTKIENLINEIREDNSQKSVSGLLLPTSVTRPILSGIMYSVPGTVDNTFSSAGLDRNDSEDQIQRSLETSMRNVINLQQPQTTGLSALRGGGQLHRSSTLGAGGGSGVGGGGVGQAKRSSAMGLASSTGSPMMARKSIQPFAHSSSYLSGIDDQSQTDECSEQHPMGVSGYDIAHDQQSLDVIEQMLQLTAPYHQSYSLKEGSNKRQRQLSSTSFHFTEKYVFYGSQILTPVEAQVAPPSLYLYTISLLIPSLPSR